MFTLIHKSTGKICEVSENAFPIHSDFEWIEDNTIDRSKIGWKKEGSILVEPPQKPDPVDEVTLLKQRLDKLERKK